jgi:hypothetical protein
MLIELYSYQCTICNNVNISTELCSCHLTKLGVVYYDQTTKTNQDGGFK